MGKYMPGTLRLTESQKDSVIAKLLEVASSLGEAGMKKTAGKTDMSSAEKEKYLNSLFNDPTGRGLKRVAYAMTEPLRTQLD